MELNKDTSLNKKTQTRPLSTGNSEQEIRIICNDILEAMKDQDIQKLMSFYAPNVIAFDVMAPFQFIGRDTYQKSWEEAFEMCSDAEDSLNEMHNLKISASETIAFAHSIRHNVMTPKEGERMDMWMRSTQCFEKIDGQWLITHEQFSVPADFETGKAIFDQKPEGMTTLH